MPIRDSVFGSGAERKNFHKLVTRWGDTFRVYHNLPFLNVVEPKPGEWLLDGDSGPDLADIIAKRWQITCDQVDQLKKTSIDYVLCDQSDRPLIGIEFDGYGGSSAKSEYLPGMGSPSPREYMTRWKLKVAHGCAFRYVVVNSEEFEDLSRTERSMIVDCLVGSVLALDATHAKAAKFSVTAIGLTEEDWAALSPAGQDQIRQDWLIGAEVSSDLDWDPLTAHLAELERTVGFHPYRTELLSKAYARRAGRSGACRRVLLGEKAWSPVLP